jgi:organic radical activating enzyme
MKHTVDYLDLVIIRSCQLACEGCCTFSDHKKIKGLVDVNDAEPAVAFWSQYINPTRVHLFGGEPTMHPQLIEWFRLARKYWPNNGPIWLNTNGYYLDKLFDHIDELFIDNISAVSVTHHTTEEPYASLVLNNYAELKRLILERVRARDPGTDAYWADSSEWDSEHKKFNLLKDSQGDILVMLNMTFQHQDHFVPHYRGHGPTLKPWQDYRNGADKEKNHAVCHIKNYVQLYQDRLWKCPPRAVLNQTLETYKLEQDPDWVSYYNEYESLGIDASQDAINTWFERQKTVENTCNMCGFMHSNTTMQAQQHLPKKLFKLKPV